MNTKPASPETPAASGMRPRNVRAWAPNTLPGERDQNYLPVLGHGPISLPLPEFGRPAR
jgi:hypothetical protein